MAMNIDRLLKKKSWTGEEVGKALMASTIHDIKHQANPDFKPLFSQADLERMEETLSTDEDYICYAVYRGLYSSVLDAYNRGQGLFQQFYHGYFRHSNTMLMCQQTDEALKRAESYPLIMTQEQYDRNQQTAREHLQGCKEPLATVLLEVLENYLLFPENAPEGILRLIEATKKEAVTNKRILASYNRALGLGYYTLQDGRKSNEMTPEEWKAAVEGVYIALSNGAATTVADAYTLYAKPRFMQALELFYNGIEGIKKLHQEVYGEELDNLSEEQEQLYLRTLEEMLSETVALKGEDKRRENREAPPSSAHIYLSRLLDGDRPPLAVWSYYPDPTNLTKYDALFENLTLYGEDEYTDKTPIEQFNELAEDYPALFAELVAHIKKIVPSFKNIVPTQYFDDIARWDELEASGLKLYTGLTDPEQVCYPEYSSAATLEEELGDIFSKGWEVERYQKKERVLKRGIAVIQNPPKEQVDLIGNYIEAPAPTDAFTNLDKLNESDSLKAELVATREKLIKPALRFIYSFNALMGIVGSVFDVEDMETVQLVAEPLETLLDRFNSLVYVFYKDAYGHASERARKRGIIKELFLPIKTAELKPTESAINAVTAELTELGFSVEAADYLKNFDRYIAILMGEGA